MPCSTFFVEGDEVEVVWYGGVEPVNSVSGVLHHAVAVLDRDKNILRYSEAKLKQFGFSDNDAWADWAYTMCPGSSDSFYVVLLLGHTVSKIIKGNLDSILIIFDAKLL